MKNNRYGRSAILSEEEKVVIRHHLKSLKYQVLWDIAIYTGERWGAIVQLAQSDCYESTGQVRDCILFRPQTRKGSGGKLAPTRQIPLHPKLKKSLEGYKPLGKIWMFPAGKNKDNHISYHSAAVKLQTTLKKCGLDKKGISTHSTRRTFITQLHRLGHSLKTIATITGHKSIETLKVYVEDDPDLIQQAISRLE